MSEREELANKMDSLAAYIAKMPVFDPSWNAEMRVQWWEWFDELCRRAALFRQPAAPVQVSEAAMQVSTAFRELHAVLSTGGPFGPTSISISQGSWLNLSMKMAALEAALQAGAPEDEAAIAERLVKALAGKTAAIFTAGNEWCVSVSRTEAGQAGVPGERWAIYLTDRALDHLSFVNGRWTLPEKMRPRDLVDYLLAAPATLQGGRKDE